MKMSICNVCGNVISPENPCGVSCVNKNPTLPAKIRIEWNDGCSSFVFETSEMDDGKRASIVAQCIKELFTPRLGFTTNEGQEE